MNYGKSPFSMGKSIFIRLGHGFNSSLCDVYRAAAAQHVTDLRGEALECRRAQPGIMRKIRKA